MATATSSSLVAQELTHKQMPSPQKLQRDDSSVLCPVTALAFYRLRHNAASQGGSPTPASDSEPSLLVLAGEDGWLAVYGATESEKNEGSGSSPRSLFGCRCYGRLRVFAEQPIQGCRVGNRGGISNSEDDEDDNILVWGGQSVAVVSRDHIVQLLEGSTADGATSRTSLPVVKEVLTPDWIYDGLLPRHSQGDSDGVSAGALITAHNEILPFRVDKSVVALLGIPISPSRPVLYSAQLAWAGSGDDIDGDGRLLIVAGTVFGEIVVWTCRLPTTDNVNKAELGIEVLDVFTGHEGSIFDVVVSPELKVGALLGGADSPGAQRRVRLLASCSDDRTICVWPLYLDRREGQGEEKKLDTHASNEARETGFQNTFEGLAQRIDEPIDGAKSQPRSAVDKLYKQNTSPPPPSTPSSSPALAAVMAHASRIWHVRFGEFSAEAAKDGNLLLYSFGEDATAQEWRLELGTQETEHSLTGKLVHLRTLSSHAGKNIWSAAVSSKTSSHGPLIATGGCDGKICLFEGRQGQSQPATSDANGLTNLLSGTIASSTIPPRAATTEPEVLPPPPPPAQEDEDEAALKTKKKKGGQKKVREDVFNSYAFLSDDQLLAATAQGRLLVGDLRQTSSETASLEWVELSGVSGDMTLSLKDYNVIRSPRGGGGGGVAAHPGAEGLAIVGNATGQLFLFSGRGGLQRLATTLSGKVDEIFFLPHTADEISDMEATGQSSINLEIIATTLFRDEAALLNLTVDVAKGTIVSESTRILKLPTKVPASPAAMVITAASRCLEYIVLGSRNGQLCLYKPVDSNDGAALSTFVLETQLQTHTRDAILSIVPLPPRSGQPPLSSASFVVAARDGTYRIYNIDKKNGTSAIRLQHETATPFGPIVRDAWFNESETPGEPPELVICGFRSTHFVVWNETRQQELATVDCGGTHRTHTYLFCSGSRSKSTSAGRVRFAYTRQSELHVFAQDVCVTVPLKIGGHGREIRSVRASAGGKYIATGGEDTVVRIWNSPRSDDNKSASTNRRCLSVLKLHNTGLHSLAWLGDDCLISAAGSEELFIWRISTITDSAYDGLAVLCESSYPDSTDDKILRIIGLDASLDPDNKDAMFVSVGLSNSILKTYRYATSSGWKLLAQGHYTGACPTQLNHLQLQNGGDLVVLAAFADGHLTVWKATPAPIESREIQALPNYADYSLLCATKTHQNAVKALDVVSIGHDAGSLMVVFTGGDDNAIAVTTLSSTVDRDNIIYIFGKTFRVSSAHAAAVTGARVLLQEEEPAGETSFTAVTCSNDQRVKAWRVIVLGVGSSDLSTAVRIQLLDDRYSAIADPGDVESI
ncbi:WD repeat-containing protein 6 [Sporothrix stenoceras]